MSILNYTDPIIAKNLNKIDEWIKKRKKYPNLLFIHQQI